MIFVGYAMVKPTGDKTDTSGLSLNVVNSNPAGGAATAADPSSALILQLLAIQNISFDTKFFEDAVYRELVDQSRPLGEREVGRPNPFLRIGVDIMEAPVESAATSTGFIETSTSGTPKTPASNSRR